MKSRPRATEDAEHNERSSDFTRSFIRLIDYLVPASLLIFHLIEDKALEIAKLWPASSAYRALVSPIFGYRAECLSEALTALSFAPVLILVAVLATTQMVLLLVNDLSTHHRLRRSLGRLGGNILLLTLCLTAIAVLFGYSETTDILTRFSDRPCLSIGALFLLLVWSLYVLLRTRLIKREMRS
jgi:hypothetical protein